MAARETQRYGQPSRWRRYGNRFGTGIVLGILLALTGGWLLPVMAQSPAWVQQNMTAQLLPLPSAGEAPSEPVPTEPSPEPLPPPIPTDIDRHWAADCIRGLATRQMLPAIATRQFAPDEPATWDFTAQLFNLSLPTEGPYVGAAPIEAALQLPSVVNALYNYPSQSYSPDRPLRAWEAVTALAAKRGLPYVARASELLSLTFEGGDRIPLYGREGTASALTAGLLVQYPNPQQWDGLQTLTRGAVAALACQASPDRRLQATIDADWVAQPQPLPPQRQPETEVRGVWLTNIDSDVLFSRENLAVAVQRLKALNINTLYPVVWNMGYSQFPSRTAARMLGREQRLWPGENPRFEAAQGDRDMLQELIELAHAEGMAVIPWFEFGFMAPAQYDLLDEHPEWFTQRLDGTREIPMGEEVFTWMNPFHPETRRLLILMMAEVLEKYEVEGIQVDDHLGLPVDMGYDPFTVGLYQQEHNGQSPPADENDPEWMKWRADKITGFMADVRRLIDRRRPGAILSLSPNPYPFSYARYLQDWPTWEQAGLLDEIIVQIYRDDLDRFVWELNKPATVSANRRTPTSIGLLSGLRGRPTNVDLLTEQLAAVRDRQYAGVSYFFYQSLWDPGAETREERENQFRLSFTKAAQRP